MKTEMGTVRGNRSAIVPTSSQPAFPFNGPTMPPRDQVLPVNHTPPEVSTPVPENLPAELSTPATCRSTTAVPTQGSHPNTEHSSTERVTRSGRVVCFISFAIMKPKTKKKQNKTFGRVIATAKKPITAGPEIKYLKKERKKKHFTCSTILVRLEILWSYISNRWF